MKSLYTIISLIIHTLLRLRAYVLYLKYLVADALFEDTLERRELLYHRLVF